MLIDDDLPVAIPAGDGDWSARALATAPLGRVDIVGVETNDGLTIATRRKLGWRYWSNGQAMAQDLDLEDTARQAIIHIISIEITSPSRHQADAYEAAITQLASAVHKPSIWPTRPISVDGTSFVLFATATAEGQAAVADLGPVRLAIYGPSIPHDLAVVTPTGLLHLCAEEGQPALWAWSAFSSRPRYARLVGLVRPTKTS